MICGAIKLSEFYRDHILLVLQYIPSKESAYFRDVFRIQPDFYDGVFLRK